MNRDELLAALAGLRRATVGTKRVPHKPLLMLWLLVRIETTGTSRATYAEAEATVSELINDFGPPVSSESASRQRAAMPFVHLERTLWSLTDMTGDELPISFPERRTSLIECGATGALRPDVEALLSDPATRASAARLLLDEHFTPTLSRILCDRPGLDLDQDPYGAVSTGPAARRARRPEFAEQVKRAFAYQCAVCGFDGALGRNPVGIEAAHLRWHSQQGPDDLTNGICLCELHHALLDLGVWGLTSDLRVTVSPLYVARTPVGRAIDALAGSRLATPRPGTPALNRAFVAWHTKQVFKSQAQVS